MKKLELKQMEEIQGGKFWGIGNSQEFTPNPLGGGWCTDCKRDYYFWIRTKAYGCGESYVC